MREGKVTISVATGSSPSASADEATVSLRIEERVSGVVLVSMELSPAEWWRLITGSVRTQDALVPEAPQIALIGKQMGNDSIKVPEPDGAGGWKARIWVRDHIKGPDDKPLVITDKVYGLIR